MKVGDLVKVLEVAMGSPIQSGVIIKQLPPLEIGLDVFEVMTSDGKVDTYTSAALRSVKILKSGGNEC